MAKKVFWITQNAAEVEQWCSKNTEKSRFELIYNGSILVFDVEDEDEELLFRMMWGHLIWA